MTELREPPLQEISTPLAVNSVGKLAPEYTTYTEFLDWLDEDTLAEWLDGKVEMTSPASLKHQNLGLFLANLLDSFVHLSDSGVVIQPPFQMRLARSGREPDLIFVSNAHLGRLQDTFLNGPADLVVEIISKESLSRDTKTKFREYAQAGIPEYWLLDPRKQTAKFYQLDAHQQYQPIPLDAEGKYHSAQLAGFWLKAEWLWQEPLPSVRTVLREIGGDAYARLLIEELRRDGFLP